MEAFRVKNEKREKVNNWTFFRVFFEVSYTIRGQGGSMLSLLMTKVIRCQEICLLCLLCCRVPAGNRIHVKLILNYDAVQMT